MSYTIIYNLVSFKALDTNGDEVTFLCALQGDSNVYDYNDRRARDWDLLAASRTFEGFVAQTSGWLPGIKSGSLKVYGLHLKTQGFFNLALSGHTKLVNKFKSAELLEGITIPASGWTASDAAALRHAFRNHFWSELAGENVHEFSEARIESCINDEGGGEVETLDALKAWRGRRLEEMVTREFSNLISHLHAHGDYPLFEEFFYYEGMPVLEDERDVDYTALKWHARRAIKRAYDADDLERIFKAAPSTMLHADEELLSLIEEAAGKFRDETEAVRAMELYHGGYKAVCDSAIKEREERMREQRKNVAEKAGDLLVEHAEFIVEKSWFTNTGSIVKTCLDGQVKALQQTTESLGTAITLDEDQKERLREALWKIQAKIADHEAGARYRKRSGHKSSAKELKRAQKIFSGYLAA